MKLLNKRLLAIAAMTILSGSAFAKTVDQDTNSRKLSRDVSDSYVLFRESSLHSFTDIIDLGIGADKRTATGVVQTASRASDESSAQSAGIYDLLLALSDEPEVTEAVLSADSSPEGTVIDLPAILIPDAHAARVPGTADRQAGDGVLFSVATIPQPGDWMTLLCGFVAVAFIARRKTSAFAD
ncbi:MAG TPA: hypothetical protein VJT81_19355 [Burkholderiales bacterium]|nr:hypothetical protein [Burkholderiales bacterium]